MQISRPRILLFLAAAFFSAAAFTLSWWRWWTYQYGTFDLAFYVQSLWLAVHGESHVSLLDVPVLGNHAEPIVFLLTPLFALLPHPMVLVAAQVLALATMPFTAWRIARKLRLEETSGAALAVLTLVAPATGFVAIHEFHPEAFAAPLLLLLYEARLSERFGAYWLWFVACMACKENIALLLFSWSVVHAWCDRKRSAHWQVGWNIGPALVTCGWLGLYGLWLSPLLNGGRVDYGNLYAHLGNSGPDIARKIFTEPHLILGALSKSIVGGNLVWSLLASFAFLPLLRPRYLFIAVPILLQHLLSSRPSEWTIHYHYAAPLIPLLWIASAEAISRFGLFPAIAFAPVLLSFFLQLFIGPFRHVPQDLRTMEIVLWNRAWKSKALEDVVNDRGLKVSAGLPYLSHLATRRDLYSLHFVLKGLKTLSAIRDDPTYNPDAVVIDFADEATFNLPGRYYHPEGQRGNVSLPSSDDLLNRFLARDQWIAQSTNAMTILRKGTRESIDAIGGGTRIDQHSQLVRSTISKVQSNTFRVDLVWQLSEPRSRIPWLMLILSHGQNRYPILLGMCVPEQNSGVASEHRIVRLPPALPHGTYEVSALFFDKIESLWRPGGNVVLETVPLGTVTSGEGAPN